MKHPQVLPPRARMVVEMGCGDGSFGAAFRRVQPACRYFGMDESRGNIREAARRLDRAACEAAGAVDFSRYGLADVDCILCRAPYWNAAALPALLAQFRQVLAPGGQVLLGVADDMTTEAVAALAPTLAQLGAATLEEIEGARYVRISRTAPQRSLGIRVLALDPVCESVRLCQPDGFLQTMPGITIAEEHLYDAQSGTPTLQREPLPTDDGVVVLERIGFPRAADALEEFAKMARDRQLIVHEYDDLPYWVGGDFYGVRLEQAFVAFRGVHAVQTSTPALADYFRAYNPYVLVFPNMLAELPPARAFSRDTDTVTIFYGALHREEDWQKIMPALNAAAARYGARLRFKVTADHAFFDALQTEQKEYVGAAYNGGGFAPYELYAAAMQESDIALLPLGDTPFNRMKSDLKFLEAAANGAVALASPTVYARTVRDGRTGFLYNDPQEFAQILGALIEDPILRAETARLAYDYVRANRMLADHYEERAAAYRALAARWDELEGARQARIAQYFTGR